MSYETSIKSRPRQNWRWFECLCVRPFSEQFPPNNSKRCDYITVRYTTVRYKTVRYKTVRYKTVRYKTSVVTKRYTFQNGTLQNGTVTKRSPSQNGTCYETVRHKMVRDPKRYIQKGKSHETVLGENLLFLEERKLLFATLALCVQYLCLPVHNKTVAATTCLFICTLHSPQPLQYIELAK